ncbi:unnamed protein product [Peronospora destructor]|uniref:Uncharacterized protein n=1 Tax=Peronospora destructor TaxID=86335 RepID=A0AAV0V5R0_9STRA|nr:unnamed protein product [Peronospora destructor]
MEFAKAFYTALFAGHSVAKSFEIGRVQADIVVASNGDNAVDGGRSEFKLLGDGDHNDAPFRDVPVIDCIKTDMDERRGGNVTINERDAIAEVFVGRSMELAELARQRCEIENQGDESSFLLILDGCNRAERQNSWFRTIVAMLLRRVNSFVLLLTGDGRFGALDGVGEKIISIGPLPLADAALLFTLRAPRKIKAHEMGGSTDLKAFGEHPIIKNLQGHPRTICAVSQFLEKKEMDVDQEEFISYIIPSLSTGLCMSRIGDTVTLDCGLDSRQRLHEQELALALNSLDECYSHFHEHHHFHRQQYGMPSCIVEEAEDQHRLESVQQTSIRWMKPVASQSNVATAKSSLKVSTTQQMAMMTAKAKA